MKNFLQHPQKVTTLGIYLISLSLLSTVASCQACGNLSTGKFDEQRKEKEEEKLVLPQVLFTSDTNFIFKDQTKFQLSLSNPTPTPANLSEYSLHLYLQEAGGTGSKLKYRDAAQQKHNQSSIEQPISHFVQQDALEKDSPIILPFELLPAIGATQVTIQIYLEDTDKHIRIGHITIVWKDTLGGSPSNTLTRLEPSPFSLELAQEMICQEALHSFEKTKVDWDKIIQQQINQHKFEFELFGKKDKDYPQVVQTSRYPVGKYKTSY